MHPFLNHYQTNPTPAADCTNTGTTGAWNGATGNSGGFQDWEIDLSAYTGKQVEVSITYAQDFATQGLGVFLDARPDPQERRGRRSTGFETGLAPLGGPARPPAPSNAATWVARGAVGFADGPGIATEDTLLLGLRPRGRDGPHEARPADGRRDALLPRALDDLPTDFVNA